MEKETNRQRALPLEAAQIIERIEAHSNMLKRIEGEHRERRPNIRISHGENPAKTVKKAFAALEKEDRLRYRSIQRFLLQYKCELRTKYAYDYDLGDFLTPEELQEESALLKKMKEAGLLVERGPFGLEAKGLVEDEKRAELEKLMIPEGVEVIPVGFFLGMDSLKKVSFPASVKRIECLVEGWDNEDFEASPFDKCLQLEEIAVDPKNKRYVSIDGNLYAFPRKDWWEYSPNCLLSYAKGKKERIFVVARNCERISAFCFANCQHLEEADLSGCWSMGEQVFRGCENLEKIICRCEKKLFRLPEYFDKNWLGGCKCKVVWKR